MAGRLKAQFNIEDVVVSVVCPSCHNKQPSPNWPSSYGWDRKDVGHVGRAGVVVCATETCRQRFPLPVTLFNLVAGG
jgi:hypothetical protein